MPVAVTCDPLNELIRKRGGYLSSLRKPDCAAGSGGNIGANSQFRPRASAGGETFGREPKIAKRQLRDHTGLRWTAPRQSTLSGSSMMSPPKGRASGSPGRRIVARRQALLREQFSTPEPSLRHAPPSLLVLRLAGKFGHQLAFGGVLQELFRRVHRDHYSLLFFSDAPIPVATIQT
jgi:hypothetical protein